MQEPLNKDQSLVKNPKQSETSPLVLNSKLSPWDSKHGRVTCQGLMVTHSNQAIIPLAVPFAHMLNTILAFK